LPATCIYSSLSMRNSLGNTTTKQGAEASGKRQASGVKQCRRAILWF
jgi:hypothetical protein